MADPTPLEIWCGKIDGLVGTGLPLGETEQGIAVQAALSKYSQHRPRVVAEDVDGDGGFDYALADLTEWSEGFSAIHVIEYPVDDDSSATSLVDDDDWQYYRAPSGRYLRFLAESPGTDETIRISYTTMHRVDATENTVPDADESAVQILSAAYFCDMLAAWYAQSQDSTIQADSVDHKSRGSEYAARARAFRKLYYDHIGTAEGKKAAASITKDQDFNGSWGGDRLTHPKRWR